jgi:rare lipoprotein A
VLTAALGLAACAGGSPGGGGGQATGHGLYKVGAPYQVGGVWYYPNVDYNYVETGIASWYGEDFHGGATANGEIYDMNALTAAHRTLPMPSMVRVTNLENGRQLALRVNDRGPFVNNRIIDVSRRAAQLLGFDRQGTARVRVEIMDAESRQLAALYGGGAQPTATAGAAPVPPAAAAPTAAVTAETLPPPPGAAAASAAPAVPAMAPRPAAVAAALPSAPTPDGKVTVIPVHQTAMFIQAGAFTDAANARRLQVRLASLGRAQIVPAMVGNQKFYRVRLGPIGTVADADAMLDRVVASGHPEARLIVD